MKGKNYFLKTYLFMILICCVSCKERAAPRIGSGKPAQISQFPYLVLIKKQEIKLSPYAPASFCGGSLISEDKVVTAAQCFFPFDKLPPSAFVVLLGLQKLDRSSEAFESDVKSYRVHEEFDPKGTFDIGIAVLETIVSKNHDSIKPIQLPSGPPKSGSMCQIVGWGHTHYGGTPSNDLSHAELSIIGHDECQKLYGKMPIHSGMMCAGGGGSTQSSCNGDTGGPLVCGNELAGVYSWGFRCNDPNHPGIYTDVFKYKDWVNGIVERSKAVSYFRSNVFNVFYALLISFARCFIKK